MVQPWCLSAHGCCFCGERTSAQTPRKLIHVLGFGPFWESMASIKEDGQRSPRTFYKCLSSIFLWGSDQYETRVCWTCSSNYCLSKRYCTEYIKLNTLDKNWVMQLCYPGWGYQRNIFERNTCHMRCFEINGRPILFFFFWGPKMAEMLKKSYNPSRIRCKHALQFTM